MSDIEEAADLRRLLKDATERALRAEMDLEMARRTARDLMEVYAEKERVLRDFAGIAPPIIAQLATCSETISRAARLQEFITLAGRAKELTE